MSIDKKDIESRMGKAVEAYRQELAGLRTGRANASLLDPIMVEVYGQKMPITQVATISVPEARLINVQVWDKDQTAAVEKSIRESSLGLNPNTEGTLIRIPLPDLNEERREELIKVASKYAEGARVAVRNVRRDGMDQTKKAKLPEDEAKDTSDEIQKFTDTHVSQIDEMLKAKEGEIRQV
ncbi:MAG: ribosome recycling factor [Alphaproteobacteria bacterium]|nr:ribosome recycling factor [Alphaproteobacteria bacterium]MBE8220824.1 ribosome recycling factor [Alphaproteobacteria bacterium]